MPKPIIMAIVAIPVIVATLIAISLLTQNEIPFSAVNPNDKIKIEYTKHKLKKISNDVIEKTVSQKTEILLIDTDGQLTYTITENGINQPDIHEKLTEVKLKRLTAIIKETGFMTIPREFFPVTNDTNEYQKATIKITLNEIINQIHWVEQNATEKFVPPIITMVEIELNQIINDISE